MDLSYYGLMGHQINLPHEEPIYITISIETIQSGSAAEEAVLKEFFQLDKYDCLEPRSDLTPDQKRMALEYLMNIKKKRDGKIKARGCADGRKQRGYILKEEVSSPTVSYDSLMLSCAIDAHERRNVVTADIPGAFLQSKLADDEEIFIVLRGKLATLFCKTNPAKYDPHLKYDRKKSEHYIYARLKKSLYGTLQAALRFWEDLANFLREQGFETNTIGA